MDKNICIRRLIEFELGEKTELDAIYSNPEEFNGDDKASDYITVTGCAIIVGFVNLSDSGMKKSRCCEEERKCCDKKVVVHHESALGGHSNSESRCQE